eukprot:127937-Pelagomonas_calceolata.AAC.1
MDRGQEQNKGAEQGRRTGAEQKGGVRTSSNEDSSKKQVAHRGKGAYARGGGLIMRRIER